MKIANILILRTNRESLPPWKHTERCSGLSYISIAALLHLQFEIPLIAKTDAIKIIKHSMTGAGRIEKVQFYTVADKGDKNDTPTHSHIPLFNNINSAEC